jgi:hypothetical protein
VDRNAIAENLAQHHVDNKGEAIVFPWVEWVKEFLDDNGYGLEEVALVCYVRALCVALVCYGCGHVCALFVVAFVRAVFVSCCSMPILI